MNTGGCLRLHSGSLEVPRNVREVEKMLAGRHEEGLVILCLFWADPKHWDGAGCPRPWRFVWLPGLTAEGPRASSPSQSLVSFLFQFWLGLCEPVFLQSSPCPPQSQRYETVSSCNTHALSADPLHSEGRVDKKSQVPELVYLYTQDKKLSPC